MNDADMLIAFYLALAAAFVALVAWDEHASKAERAAKAKADAAGGSLEP